MVRVYVVSSKINNAQQWHLSMGRGRMKHEYGTPCCCPFFPLSRVGNALWERKGRGPGLKCTWLNLSNMSTDLQVVATFSLFWGLSMPCGKGREGVKVFVCASSIVFRRIFVTEWNGVRRGYENSTSKMARNKIMLPSHLTSQSILKKIG